MDDPPSDSRSVSHALQQIDCDPCPRDSTVRSPLTTRSAVADIQGSFRAGLQMPLSTRKPSLMMWTLAVLVTRFSVPLLTPNVVGGEGPNTMGLVEGSPTSGTGS